MVEAGKPLVKELEALGVTVTDLNAEQRKAFADAAKAVYTKWKPQVAPTWSIWPKRRLPLANKELFTLNLKGIQAYIYLNPFIYKRQMLCYFSIAGSPWGQQPLARAHGQHQSHVSHQLAIAARQHQARPPAHCSLQNSGPRPSTAANAEVCLNHAPQAQGHGQKGRRGKKVQQVPKKDDEIHVQHDPNQVFPLGLTLGR